MVGTGLGEDHHGRSLRDEGTADGATDVRLVRQRERVSYSDEDVLDKEGRQRIVGAEGWSLARLIGFRASEGAESSK